MVTTAAIPLFPCTPVHHAFLGLLFAFHQVNISLSFRGRTENIPLLLVSG